eukprot:scaffold8798_cov117-Cylindrotheca_fusiformis.AAC.2
MQEAGIPQNKKPGYSDIRDSEQQYSINLNTCSLWCDGCLLTLLLNPSMQFLKREALAVRGSNPEDTADGQLCKSSLSFSHRQPLHSFLSRPFSSTSNVFAGRLGDICDSRVVSSPFPPIPEGPYQPVPEFVMANWKGSGGVLGEETAIVDGSTGLRRSFDDYYNATCGLAGSLKHEFQVTEKSTVCLFAPNHVDFLPVTVAVGLCGAKLTPVNPLYTRDELLMILDRSESSILIAHVRNLETALAAAKDSKYVKHVFVMTEHDEAPPEGVLTLESIKKHDKGFDKTIRDHHPSTDLHPFLLPYSSGTTGMPKGVCLTHSNIVANLQQFNTIESLSFEPGETIISPLPFFHIYGMTATSLFSGWKGNPIITMSGRFDLELFLNLIEEHRPSRGHLVPPILVGLAKHPMVDDYSFDSLKCLICAAAPLGIETEKAVQKRLGCHVKQAWGMSELSPIGTCNADDNIKSASIGPLVSSTQGKIIDENGKSLGPNEAGELLVKGPQVMLGYMDDPDKTDECLSESGWLRTGDVAYYDEDGFFFIQDRMKELIKVRGFQVAPAELEELLLSNDSVNDAAVIQIPDEKSGELPRAYIVLKDDPQNGTEEEMKNTIYEWVKEKVAPYKRLDGGIYFIDAIPKSPSGKILRRILRDQVKEEMLEQKAQSA